jgi:hypothetical protein
MKYIKPKRGPHIFDYRGFKLGKLTILEYEKGRWICECECGNDAIVRTGDIKNNRRFACRSCTASEVTIKRNHNIEHYGYRRRIYREYIKGSKKRNLDFNLTFDDFNKLISDNCYYCGSKPIEKPNKSYMVKILEPLKVNGIDRLNSTIGYKIDNCVTCCSKCNYSKHEMSVEEFKEWIIKIYNNFIDTSRKS